MSIALFFISLAYTFLFPQRAPLVIVVVLVVTFASAAFEAVGMGIAGY